MKTNWFGKDNQNKFSKKEKLKLMQEIAEKKLFLEEILPLTIALG